MSYYAPPLINSVINILVFTARPLINGCGQKSGCGMSKPPHMHWLLCWTPGGSIMPNPKIYPDPIPHCLYCLLRIRSWSADVPDQEFDRTAASGQSGDSEENHWPPQEVSDDGCCIACDCHVTCVAEWRRMNPRTRWAYLISHVCLDPLWWVRMMDLWVLHLPGHPSFPPLSPSNPPLMVCSILCRCHLPTLSTSTLVFTPWSSSTSGSFKWTRKNIGKMRS